jgi:hypothetical protein
MDCCYYVQNLRNNQSRKCDSHNSDERLFEKFKTKNHNDYTLVNTYPNPNEKSLCVHLTRFSQGQIKIRIE